MRENIAVDLSNNSVEGGGWGYESSMEDKLFPLGIGFDTVSLLALVRRYVG